MIDPGLSISAVQLAVSDLGRSADFYERVLGLPVRSRGEGRAELGPAGSPAALTLVELEEPAPPAARSTGLYHVAWLHPSRGALADTVRRVVGAHWRIDGASDHGVSEALYLSDPDGLGIEIYADRPRESWGRPPAGHGVVMFTAPLDIDDLMAQSGQAPPAAVDPGTVVGHVHMKVSDVPCALAYYRDVLGFEQQAELGDQAAFVSAGGYHHHVGLNSWESRGAGPASDAEPGLRRVEFLMPGEGSVENLAAAAGGEVRGGVLELRDRDGQLIAFAGA